MSEPQKSRSIQRREAIQRGEEMPTFSRTDNTPDPPAAPPMSVEAAKENLRLAVNQLIESFHRGYGADDAMYYGAVNALIAAGEVYTVAHEAKGAREYLDRAAQLVPDRDEAPLALARLARQQG